ncbi:MAG: alpha/beta hydrolase, partial [Verrucomicrobiota bacterium]
RQALHALLDACLAGGRTGGDLALLGFSQGCLMALEAGLRYPHRLAAVVGISGWVHEVDRLVQEAPPEARQVPVLMTHGTWDPLIPCAAVEPQARTLRAAGFDVAWQELAKEHTVDSRMEIGLIRAFLEAAFGRTSSGRVRRGRPET